MSHNRKKHLLRWRKSSLHVHSRFSDGRADPEEYVEKALELGLNFLGFSEHGPVPFASEWNMPAARLSAYTEEIKRLKKKYHGRIEILTGLETDYIAGVQGPATFSGCGLDYTIGGVHYCRVDDRYLEIDHTPQILQTVIDRVFGGDVRRMVSAYFDLVCGMLAAQPPTILAHLDLVKKFNRQMRLFDENESWYREEVFRVLEALARTDVILEVNTAPLYRGFGDEPYPSAFILKTAHELSIPVVLTSDAHAPEYLTAAFTEALALLRSCGYQQ